MKLIPGDNVMALVSPGVQVTVIDESFYTPAEPGTTPLIVVATAQDKSNAGGTGTASATTKANAGKAFRLTSQKDLVDLYGVPFFELTASGSPIHGSERNEYGLLAAYSLLGVSNSVFITRADVDLNELEPDPTEPGAEADDGQWWVDTSTTAWGIQEWNSNPGTTAGGQKFSAKFPIVLTSDDALNIEANQPKQSIGNVGDYAVVFETTYTGSNDLLDKESAKIWYKSAGNGDSVESGTWVLVGSNDWSASHAAVKGTVAVPDDSILLPMTLEVAINNSTITSATYTTLQQFADAINGVSGPPGVSAQVVNNRLHLFSDGTTSADASTADGTIFLEDISGVTWEQLGITPGVHAGPKLSIAPHTQVPTYKRNDNPDFVNGFPTGSVWIKTTEPNNGARWRVKRWSTDTKTWQAYSAPIYENNHGALYYLDRSGGGVNIPVDELFVQFNADENSGFDSTPIEAKFRVFSRANAGASTVTSDVLQGASNALGASTYTFTMKQSIRGSASLVSAEAAISFIVGGADTAADVASSIAAAINAATFGFDNTDPANPVEIPNYVSAVPTSDNRVQISHTSGGEIRFKDGSGTPLGKIFYSGAYNSYSGEGLSNLYTAPSGDMTSDFIVSNWKPLAADDFVAAVDAPLNNPDDGQLWYNPNFGEADIMIHNGTTWVGYHNYSSAYANTDPNGAQVSASEPDSQSDGTPLQDGDLWISTADLENFPTIYRYNGDAQEFVLIDKADQTTEDGILFADARAGTSGGTPTVAPSGTIAELLDSNHLDPDAPDPDLYPKGMMLYNLRRSGGNVKRWNAGYIDVAEDNIRANNESMENYYPNRWVTASANNEDGSGSFGRKAQRKVVVSAMKSVIDTSQEIRDEERRNFNMIAAPGYPETLSNLINLNLDRGVTAFVIGDTPLRLKSDATTLTNWGTNAALVTDNGDDGIVSYDEYCAVYYPNGFTTDLSGNNAVVPASHMMLRTIALSDQVSYPWFAPAGTRRGGITNATSVGYIDSLTGEFQTVALNEGTRDLLYDLKVNPIPFFVGVGHVAWGQKTRGRNASALDRINVARLIVYLRSQLNKLARPYIFEPNDKITRDEIKGAVESLLLELVGLRAIYDFAVVCDETNNTPSRVDRNELYVDIAIEPVKAVEFIYIPLRVKNTGEI